MTTDDMTHAITGSEWQSVRTQFPLNACIDLWQVDHNGQGLRVTDAIFRTGFGFCDLKSGKPLWRSDAEFTHWMKPPPPPTPQPPH